MEALDIWYYIIGWLTSGSALTTAIYFICIVTFYCACRLWKQKKMIKSISIAQCSNQKALEQAIKDAVVQVLNEEKSVKNKLDKVGSAVSDAKLEVIASDKQLLEFCISSRMMETEHYKSIVGDLKEYNSQMRQAVSEECSALLRLMKQKFDEAQNKNEELLKMVEVGNHAIVKGIENLSEEEKNSLQKMQVCVSGMGREILNQNVALAQKTEGILSNIQDVWKGHLDTLAPMEERLKETEKLYKLLQGWEKQIHEQELSLNMMFAKHIQIAENSEKLNKTAKDVFELIKLLLLESIANDVSITGKKK